MGKRSALLFLLIVNIALATGKSQNINSSLALEVPSTEEVVTSERLYRSGRQQTLLRYYKQPGARIGVRLLVYGNAPPISPCAARAAVPEPLLTDALPWRLGLDVYELSWCDSTDYLQRNAHVLTAVIERIRTGLGSQEKFLIEARSLGGVIARYALTQMESERNAHRVNVFISNDSPQMGAYVPLGVQFAAGTRGIF